jgi:cell wall-associated NlpC family hydrolase
VPPPAPAPPPAPSAPAPGAETAIDWAYQQLGKPYVWGAEGPDAFDCSGLTKVAWAQAGVQLTHSSRIQYQQTTKVPVSQAQRGDLLFYSHDGTQAGIFHVGIYLGDGQVIHALRDWSSWSGTKVTGMYYASGLLPYAGRP